MKNFIYTFVILITSGMVYATNPVVSNVAILGVGLYNATPNPDEFSILTGSYDFSDADGHMDVSTYNWYIDTDNDGFWNDESSVATTLRYSVTAAAVGHNVFFIVNPRDSNGETNTAVASTGSSVASTTLTDFNSDVNVNITANTDWLNGHIKQNRTLTIDGPYTLTIYGDMDLTTGGIVIDLKNGASLIVKGQLITANNLIISVDATSAFIIESGLDARNNSSLTISGTMTVEGDVNVEQNATFNINEGGALDVAGDLTTGDNAVLDIEGDVTVDGSATFGTNTTITVDSDTTGTGTLVIGGDLTAGAGSTLVGGGDVTVGGVVTGPAEITGDAQLPIELVAFDVKLNQNIVELSWITASEINNDYFSIERSLDGINYEIITQIKGQGNSSQLVYYSISDETAPKGIVYYRLKQTDFDGKSELFKAKALYNNDMSLNSSMVNIFPNPVIEGGVINIVVGEMLSEKEIKINVVDILGKSVYSSTLKFNGYNQMHSFMMNEHAVKGLYFVIIDDNNQKISKKLIIN